MKRVPIPIALALTFALAGTVCLEIVALQGCAARPIHPGAVDKLDSQAYDVLIVAQAILDDAKAQVKSGKIPASAKDIINKAGQAYEVLRLAQRTYHEAVPAIRSKSAGDLLNAIKDVDRLISDVRALATVGR